MRVWPGKSYPLGAIWDGSGVNFSLFSEHATSVELCLFDSPDATRETHRIRFREQTDQVWHGYLPTSYPDSAMRTVSTAPTTLHTAIDSTAARFFSIRTHER